MTIAEQVTRLKTDFDEVYEAGYTAGHFPLESRSRREKAATWQPLCGNIIRDLGVHVDKQD